jgi:hypothetical protein
LLWCLFHPKFLVLLVLEAGSLRSSYMVPITYISASSVPSPGLTSTISVTSLYSLCTLCVASIWPLCGLYVASAWPLRDQSCHIIGSYSLTYIRAQKCALYRSSYYQYYTLCVASAWPLCGLHWRLRDQSCHITCSYPLTYVRAQSVPSTGLLTTNTIRSTWPLRGPCVTSAWMALLLLPHDTFVSSLVHIRVRRGVTKRSSDVALWH